LCSIIITQISGNKSYYHHRAAHMWNVLIWWCAARCPKGIVSDTAFPSQCHAALGTIPHTLASVDQRLVRC
jgi:hypothetical protein